MKFMTRDTVPTTAEWLAALAVTNPLATEAPAPFVQTEQHKRELGERIARATRRRQAAERGEDWQAVS